MRTDRHIQALHAAISRRSWHDVEVAANEIRDREDNPDTVRLERLRELERENEVFRRAWHKGAGGPP